MFMPVQILGLDICADTIVGNEMLRGISGGQRKRVTTGIFFFPFIILIFYINMHYTYILIFIAVFPSKNVFYRRDDCRTSKSSVHGWDIHRSWQLHNIPDSKISQANDQHSWWHDRNFLASACSGDLRPFRRHNPPFRWAGCVPRPTWECARVLWVHGVQVPWEEGRRWLLTRSKLTSRWLLSCILYLPFWGFASWRARLLRKPEFFINRVFG